MTQDTDQPVPVAVPREVLDGLEAVRRSGRTNMLDRPVVARIAGELGYDATARWVREHRELYATGVFASFEAEEEAR